MKEKKNFEAIFKEDLYQYLLSIDKVDAHLPEAPDLEVATGSLLLNFTS